MKNKIIVGIDWVSGLWVPIKVIRIKDTGINTYELAPIDQFGCLTKEAAKKEVKPFKKYLKEQNKYNRAINDVTKEDREQAISDLSEKTVLNGRLTHKHAIGNIETWKLP